MTLIYDFLSHIGFAPEGPGDIMTEQVVPCARWVCLLLTSITFHYIHSSVPYKHLEGIKKQPIAETTTEKRW